MRTPTAITAALTAAVLTLGACADDSTGGSAVESATSSPSAATSGASPPASTSPSVTPTRRPTKSAPIGTTVTITIRGDTVTPNGKRIEVDKGEPVTLQIDADTAGELHVHSTPEREIAFDEGRSTRKLTIDQPGIVDVEEHALEQVIVQLEVR